MSNENKCKEIPVAPAYQPACWKNYDPIAWDCMGCIVKDKCKIETAMVPGG